MSLITIVTNKYEGPPFRWNEERRFLLRCELDAAYFHLYGIESDDVDYILETFPIVKRKVEKLYGEYRTKRVILEMYDDQYWICYDYGCHRLHLLDISLKDVAILPSAKPLYRLR